MVEIILGKCEFKKIYHIFLKKYIIFSLKKNSEKKYIIFSEKKYIIYS